MEAVEISVLFLYGPYYSARPLGRKRFGPPDDIGGSKQVLSKLDSAPAAVTEMRR